LSETYILQHWYRYLSILDFFAANSFALAKPANMGWQNVGIT